MNNDAKLYIVILAAGLGTRMKSNVPKVLHLLAGKPLLQWVVDLAYSLDEVSNVIAVIGPEFQYNYSNLKIAIQSERLGTAHALATGLKHINTIKDNDHIVVLYGDTPLIDKDSITSMLDKLHNHDLIVAGFTSTQKNSYGRLILSGDDLLKIVEAKDASKTELEIDLCNSGIMALKGFVAKEYLPLVKNDNMNQEYYLTDLVELVAKAKKKASYIKVKSEEFLGINSLAELANLEANVQNNLRTKHLANGVQMIDPKSVYFSYDTQIEAGTKIEPNVYFGTKVRIGSNVVIKAFSHIVETTLGDECEIGPFARIRGESDIGTNAKIGNFVEIKKSRLGDQVKASHLTYIGDAEIGSKTNIGAGTITCNYDGKQKHKTIIGEGVFIGSNTSLIAPLNIGNNSLIAAGSTITDDVGKEELAIARARQTNKIK